MCTWSKIPILRPKKAYSAFCPVLKSNALKNSFLKHIQLHSLKIPAQTGSAREPKVSSSRASPLKFVRCRLSDDDDRIEIDRETDCTGTKLKAEKNSRAEQTQAGACPLEIFGLFW